MGFPVGSFNGEVGGVSSSFSLPADSSSLLRSHSGFFLCKAAVTMRNGSLQLVALWLAAQTIDYFYVVSGGTFACDVCFALVLQHLRRVFA